MAKKLGVSYRDGGNDNSELRSYPSSCIGRLYSEKNYKDFSVGIELTAILRSGYYEGGNLDWQIEYDLNGDNGNDTIPEIQGLKDDIKYFRECTDGKAAQLAGFAIKWMKKETKRLIEALEGIYSDFSDPYVRVATFSNGETIYKKAG